LNNLVFQMVENSHLTAFLASRFVRRSAATPSQGLSAGATIWLFLNNLGLNNL